nr:reverse transcriptase domain-containing protein [Tanacetum cinerariifolium]
MAAKGNTVLPVPDLRTMEELCQPSLIGRVQNSCQFHGLPGDDANKHLDKFLHVTQSIKVNEVTDNALRLYLFSYYLTHHATAWFDRLPRNSINTFEQMANIFLGKYFSPSMVTKLRNEITNFRQRPDESLFKAWERYKLSIDRCPNHNMLPVTQINTFYNGLTLRHRDTINAAAGVTFMKRRLEECYDLIENMTTHHNDWDTSAQRSESSNSITSSFDTEITALKAEMPKINKNLMRVLQVNQQVKAVTPNYENCGGPHSFNGCPATVGNTQNVYAAGAYQGNSYKPQGNRNLLSYRSGNYLGPSGFNQNQNRNNQNKNFHNQNKNKGNHNPQGNNQGRNQFFHGANQGQNQLQAYQAPAYQAPIYQDPVHQPQISQPQVVTTNEFTNFMKANDAILKNIRKTDATKDTVHPTNNRSTKDVQPSVVQTESLIPNSVPVVAPIIELVASPVSAPKPNQRPSISYPSRFHDQKLRDKANDQREKFFRIFKDLNFNISYSDALILMPKFGPTIKTLITNKDKLSELARTPLNEHCSVVLLKKLPKKLGDPGKFLIPCDFPGMAECLPLTDLGASINLMPLSVWNKLSLLDLSPTCMTLELVDHLISCPVGVVEDVFVKTERDLIDVFKEYSQEVLGFSDAIISGNPTLYYDPIVSTTSPTLTPFGESDFILEEVDAFLALEDDSTSPEVDQSYVDTEGDILLLEALLNDDSSLPPPNQGNYLPQEDFEPAVQHQRRVNPKIHDVIKNEVLKLLDAGLIYPISDSPWVSPVHCVPKKGGFTVVENEENELISTRLVTGWHVCIDYRYFQIPIDPKDQEKTTFTCSYGTFAYCRMPFGLCNAPGTFQRCMMAIFHDMIEKTMEVFMDHFSVFRNSFQTYLSHLEKMVNRIEVDKAKVDVIAKLPHPTNVKGIHSLLGHAGFKDSPSYDSSGQSQEKHFRPIHYDNKTMTEAESNYTTTEKEMLDVVYAFEKFWSYLIMNKSIVYTDHFALKYLFDKKDSKVRFLCWVLLLQEFIFKVIDTKGAENLAADHLSRLENPHQNVLDAKEINESFPLDIC